MAMSLPIMVQDIAPDSTFATVAATKPVYERPSPALELLSRSKRVPGQLTLASPADNSAAPAHTNANKQRSLLPT